ncbi:MAG TPA: DUF1574 family protein [Gemmata sp.]|nr:DUF1574 family protein [Gemmata sp.]
MTRSRGQRTRRSARWSLAWAAIGFVLFQVGIIAAGDLFAPELYDPEYSARLSRLQARHAEHPERPLLVLLGSSRTAQLFRPEQLPPIETTDGRVVIPFNFSRAGGGPVYSRIALSRICQQSLKPEWVVVEFMPALMMHRYERFFYTSITASEIGDLARYISGRRAVGCYAKLRLLPGYKLRTGLLRVLAPSWILPIGDSDPATTIDALGGEGKRIRPSMPNAERRAEDLRVSTGYARLLAGYKIDPGADRALRDLLHHCRETGIHVVMVRTPESSTFRAGYEPQALATLAEYESGLTREFGVRVIDAREWLPDEDFEDGHHPLLSGQVHFTDRLYRDVLIPLVRGRLDGPAK